VERYAELAKRLLTAGDDVVIIGTLAEGPLAHAIQRAAPRARDLTGRTDFVQIASLGARAALAVGNDAGALHLIAAAGAPTIALFSSASDPAISAPRGHVTILQSQSLKDLPTDEVFRTAQSLIEQPA
jgi:ADP-heptose:LPS heptosyltransferase